MIIFTCYNLALEIVRTFRGHQDIYAKSSILKLWQFNNQSNLPISLIKDNVYRAVKFSHNYLISFPKKYN